MTAVLIADSIGKAFGTRKVLVSARLEARQGTVTFVAGRNGTGKSTLLKIAAGWLTPDYGTIRFGERLFTRPRLHQLARDGLFFLPDREILSPSFTLRSQLSVTASRFGGRAVEQIAQQLGIDGLLDRGPTNLSGGERRRAELALAFVRAPRCLIADEPLRGIDPKDAEFLLEHLTVFAKEGCAVIVSGHDATALMGSSDEVVWVTSGTSYQLGTPAEALNNESFRREYVSGAWT